MCKTEQTSLTHLWQVPGQQFFSFPSVLQKLAAIRKSSQPVEFFSFLRNFTADGFFTSKIGIKYLGYKGNTYLTDFPGCPAVLDV
jgi:hypothetical protein